MKKKCILNYKSNYLSCILVLFLFSQGIMAQNAYLEREQRTEWFRDARFGMFIHWGIYAIPARGEWVRNHEKMTLEQYQPFFDTFNPKDYNPAEWARIAKNAGMKYAVITAKHHDGFCLFDSKYTDYKSTNTPANRDLIKEFVDAFRAEGLKVGFYYSLIDWHHRDYPNVGNHPMRGDPEWNNKNYDWDNYVQYMHNQVSELLTNYGKIDIMWFDYSFGEYSGEKWKALELVKMVRNKQPEIIIDNRLGGDMGKENPEVYAGDFEGPEQIIPYKNVLDDFGRPIPWESCITLNNAWGYKRDYQYKTTVDIIRTLVNCVSKNGNLLLNVGPDARGNIPAKSIEVLNEVGQWMKSNKESVYGCGPAEFEKPEWGRFTQKGDTLYAHVFEKSIGQYCLRNMKGRVKSATLLQDGSEVHLTDYWQGGGKSRPYLGSNDWFMNFGKPIQHTYDLPDERNTVVKILLTE